MRLWTIQSEAVCRLIQDTGVYRCDPYQSVMLQPMDDAKIGMEICEQFAAAYDWLVRQMEKRIGPRPEGVIYPVWAWYQYGNKRKPDLRKERWANGSPGERLACMLLEVPDRDVLLSDFGEWHAVLGGLMPISDTEEEAERLEKDLESLSEEERQAFLAANWERIFDVRPFENDWTRRGADVQATFWELKKEYVRDIRFFTAGKRKETGQGSI